MTELDNPAWGALSGVQRGLATVTRLAGRFHPAVSPFGGFADRPTERHWADLGLVLGPGGTAVVMNLTPEDLLPPGWTKLRETAGVQMLGDALVHGSGWSTSATPPVDEILPLDVGDVTDMLSLVAEAQPGPFLPRTIEFGGYLGIRRGGQLIAMAGQRLRPPGFAEISAVATLADFRRQGLAEYLVRAVVAGIVGRGEVPFLHASADNDRPIRLYEAVGFTRRRPVVFTMVRAPGLHAPGLEGDLLD